MLPISPDGERLVRLSGAMIALTALAVVLRFGTRIRSKAPLAADDWWAAASLIFFLVYMSAQIWTVVHGGIGYPLTSLPYPQLTRTAKILYISVPISVSTTATAKISILCLYRRVFTTPSFQTRSLIVGMFVMAYWISSVVGSVARCRPARAAYELLVPGKCINFAAFFLGEEIFNCLLDVIMLCLPITVVRTLNMPTQRKIQVCLIFMLGGLVLIAGIVRMAVIYRAGSENLSLVGDLVWASIENGLALICACLPTYGPLLSKAHAITLSLNSWYSSLLSTRSWRGTQSKQSSSSGTAQPSDSMSRKRYNQIHDGTQDTYHVTESVGADAGDEFVAGKDYPLDTIKVKSTVEIV